VLLIRNEQMEIMRCQRMSVMVTRATAHVRRFYPAKVVDLEPSQLELLLRDTLRVAYAYGFVTTSQALKFVNLSIELGVGFYRSAPYAVILQATDHLTADERVLHVRRCMALNAEDAQ